MGCMAFSHGYGKIPPEDYSVEAIRGAYRHGCTFFDTAEIYSPGLSGIGHNERIVGRALADVRDDVAAAMGRLIDEGLIRGWGLSQVDVDEIDRAQRVCPLAAVQNIYSMVERDAERAVIPYCDAHGIGFVAFSPIASGLLSGKVTERTQFERYDDVRTWVPQLSRRNIRGNRPIVELVERFAAHKGATPAQISLAWMLRKSPCAVPIPGSKNKGRIIENLDAARVTLTDEEFRELDAELGRCRVYGHRGLAR